MNKIRPLIGFCPQHEIIYENLTVFEHLDLIASVYLKKLVLKLIDYIINDLTNFVRLKDILESLLKVK